MIPVTPLRPETCGHDGNQLGGQSNPAALWGNRPSASEEEQFWRSVNHMQNSKKIHLHEAKDDRFDPTAQPNTGFEPLLDSDEAAALLKIHPKTLQRKARRGEITGIQIGKLWRFRASALNEWLEKIAG